MEPNAGWRTCRALSHDILAFYARISGKQLPAGGPPRRCGYLAFCGAPTASSPAFASARGTGSREFEQTPVEKPEAVATGKRRGRSANEAENERRTALLARLVAGEITNAEAAAELGIKASAWSSWKAYHTKRQGHPAVAARTRAHLDLERFGRELKERVRAMVELVEGWLGQVSGDVVSDGLGDTNRYAPSPSRGGRPQAEPLANLSTSATGFETSWRLWRGGWRVGRDSLRRVWFGLTAGAAGLPSGVYRSLASGRAFAPIQRSSPIDHLIDSRPARNICALTGPAQSASGGLLSARHKQARSLPALTDRFLALERAMIPERGSSFTSDPCEGV